MGIHSTVTAIPVGYGIVAQKTHDDDTMTAALEWVAKALAGESDNIVDVRIKFGETEGGIKELFSYNGPSRAALTAVRRLRAADDVDTRTQCTSVVNRLNEVETRRNTSRRIDVKSFHGIDY